MALTVRELNDTATPTIRPAERVSFPNTIVTTSADSLRQELPRVYKGAEDLLIPEAQLTRAGAAFFAKWRASDTLFSSTRQRLAQISLLERDWDSYGAEPVSSNAVSRANELLQSLEEPLADLVGELLRPYALAPLANGGVQLEWRGSGAALEVEVGPKGELGYLLIEGEGSERTFKEADDVMSSDILHRVARVLMS